MDKVKKEGWDDQSPKKGEFISDFIEKGTKPTCLTSVRDFPDGRALLIDRLIDSLVTSC